MYHTCRLQPTSRLTRISTEQEREREREGGLPIYDTTSCKFDQFVQVVSFLLDLALLVCELVSV